MLVTFDEVTDVEPAPVTFEKSIVAPSAGAIGSGSQGGGPPPGQASSRPGEGTALPGKTAAPLVVSTWSSVGLPGLRSTIATSPEPGAET